MDIPHNLLTGVVHSLASILMETKDKDDQRHTKFMRRLVCLPLYDTTTGNDATTVVHVRAKAAHKFTSILPPIMQSRNPTAKCSLKNSPWIHRRVTQNNTPGGVPLI
jgi:hypothetical protein